MTTDESSEQDISGEDISGEDLRRDYPVTLPDGREAVLSVNLTHEGLIADVFCEDEYLTTFANTAEEFVWMAMGM